MSDPLVTVVMATFNRCDVLTFALRSVVAQTFTDWELWVIGDACTDGTAAAVESVADPRIQFVNMPQYCGEQSGPNNEGIRRARGRYVAFLNHDDLWFPDHLALAVARLQAGDADLVYTAGALIAPDGDVSLASVTPSDRWEPTVSVPASCWVARRETFATVGPWRNFRQCWAAPSQDWLFRAGRQGTRMELVPQLTLVVLASALRKDSYISGDADEHRRAYASLAASPDQYRTELLRRAAFAYAADARHPKPLRHHVVRAAKDVVRRLCGSMGVSEQEFQALVRHRRRGGFINQLREVRGLPRR